MPDKERNMWKIIAADLKYWKVPFLVIACFYALLFVFNVLVPGYSYILARLFGFTLIFLGVVLSSEEGKTKKIRLFAGLPVSVRRLGQARFPIIYGLWFVLLFFFVLTTLIGSRGNPGQDFFWLLLTMTGSMFFLAACIVISQDLPHLVRNKSLGNVLRLTMVFPAVASFIIYYFITIGEKDPLPLTDELKGLFLSPAGSVSFILLALAATVLSVFIYERRKAYTE
jgi:hypothetical protein